MSWNIDPPVEELHVMMEAGFLYRDARMWNHARDVFQGVRSLRPQSDVPEVALGTVAFQQGQFDVARKHYQRALERNPDSAFALAHLAELALFEKDREKAGEHAAEALRRDPDGPFGNLAREVAHLAAVVEFKG